LAAAASRELLEEIGLHTDSADLRYIAYTEGHADLGWANGLFRDDFFLHRVSSHDIDVAPRQISNVVITAATAGGRKPTWPPPPKPCSQVDQPSS
jgi:8-oxo-dGTP pyrophosphatase MutT (NUDIX family)